MLEEIEIITEAPLLVAENDFRRLRIQATEDALRDPFMDRETAFTLLEEMAEIQIALDKE